MPMIDVYAAAGTFADTHRLATDLATAVMTIEQVPNIPCSARTRRRSCMTARGRDLECRWRQHVCPGPGADQRRRARP